MVFMDPGSLFLGVALGVIGALSGMTTFIIFQRRQNRLQKQRDLESQTAHAKIPQLKTSRSAGTFAQQTPLNYSRSAATNSTYPSFNKYQPHTRTTTPRPQPGLLAIPTSPLKDPRSVPRKPIPARTTYTVSVATQTTPVEPPRRHQRLRSIASTLQNTFTFSSPTPALQYPPPTLNTNSVYVVSPLTPTLAPPNLPLPAELPAQISRQELGVYTDMGREGSFVSSFSETTVDPEDVDYESTILYAEFEDEVVPVPPLKGKEGVSSPLSPVSLRKMEWPQSPRRGSQGASSPLSPVSLRKMEWQQSPRRGNEGASSPLSPMSLRKMEWPRPPQRQPS